MTAIRLKEYARRMGGQGALSAALKKAGHAYSRSLVNRTCNYGSLPKRQPDRYRNAINQVLTAHGFDAASAWQPQNENALLSDPPTKVDAHEGLQSRSQSSGDKTPLEDYSMANKTKEYLEPEMLRHFNLKDDPFFDLGDHRAIWLNERLERIKHRIFLRSQNQGMMVITGDFGSGKSTLLRHVLREMLSDPRYHVIMPDRLDRKAMRGDALSLSIVDQMSPPGAHVPASAVRRDRLSRTLLTKAIQRGEYPILVIDEAHELNEDIFIALKRLWDSGLIFRNVAILLAGAGGIDDKGRPWGLRWQIEGNSDLREFAERAELIDLGRLAECLPDYLAWRFTAVGGDIGTVFESEALAELVERGGTPQRLGNLAIRAMREAYLDGALKVTVEHAAGA
jgi:type II secretory pathway predicted ATPase ExeA